MVLGGSDGAIECVALTAALNGAGVPFGTIVIAGFAFAVAGALSMFFSSYLSARSELNALQTDVQRERMEIETEPEEERAELEELLRNEGYDKKEIDVIMSKLVKNKEMWLREQLRRELKVNMEDLKGDSLTGPTWAGISFLLLSLLVVAPYALVWEQATTLAASVLFSILALFLLGSRAFIPGHAKPMGGIESAAVGAVAAALLYGLGLLISHL